MSPRVRNPADRFWEHVNKENDPHPTLGTPCWLWTGSIRGNGYGRFCRGMRGNVDYAHRFSYEMEYGEVPDGLCALYRCDVRACVNPAHFFLGTRGDNNRDARDKGRSVQPKANGELNGKAKLTSLQVQEIRSLRDEMKPAMLSSKYGVSIDTVYEILRGDTWKSLP